MAITLFRVFGVLGIVLMGAALAIAPVAAVEGRMVPVSMLGIGGMVALVIAWLARRMAREASQAPDRAPE